MAAAAVRHTIGEVVYRSDAHRDVWRCHELSKAASQSDQLELDQQQALPMTSERDDELFTA